MTSAEMVEKFNNTFAPHAKSNIDLKWSLVEEEYHELKEEAYNLMFNSALADRAQLAKEGADLVYVLYGYMQALGIDLDEAVRQVHISNMSKVGDDGKPVYREDGKVLKGANYQPPDMSSALRSK
jgi:predicted HAD superfamily Cof-like phosphohydrolase